MTTVADATDARGYVLHGLIGAEDVRALFERCAAMRFTGVLELFEGSRRTSVPFVEGEPLDGPDLFKLGAVWRRGQWQLLQRAVDLEGNLTDSVSLEGSLGETSPMLLFRHCEDGRLSAVIDFDASDGQHARVRFARGRLEMAEVNGMPNLGALATIGAWEEGAYRLVLEPQFVLVEAAPAAPSSGPRTPTLPGVAAAGGRAAGNDLSSSAGVYAAFSNSTHHDGGRAAAPVETPVIPSTTRVPVVAPPRQSPMTDRRAPLYTPPPIPIESVQSEPPPSLPPPRPGSASITGRPPLPEMPSRPVPNLPRLGGGGPSPLAPRPTRPPGAEPTMGRMGALAPPPVTTPAPSLPLDAAGWEKALDEVFPSETRSPEPEAPRSVLSDIPMPAGPRRPSGRIEVVGAAAPLPPVSPVELPGVQGPRPGPPAIEPPGAAGQGPPVPVSIPIEWSDATGEASGAVRSPSSPSAARRVASPSAERAAAPLPTRSAPQEPVTHQTVSAPPARSRVGAWVGAGGVLLVAAALVVVLWPRTPEGPSAQAIPGDPPPAGAAPAPSVPANPAGGPSTPVANAPTPSPAAPLPGPASRFILAARKATIEGNKREALRQFKAAWKIDAKDPAFALYVPMALGKTGRGKLVLDGAGPLLVDGHPFKAPAILDVAAGPHVVGPPEVAREVTVPRGGTVRASDGAVVGAAPPRPGLAPAAPGKPAAPATAPRLRKRGKRRRAVAAPAASAAPSAEPAPAPSAAPPPAP